MNGIRTDQREFLELFPWESEEQKQDFLHMLKWTKDQKIPFQLLTQTHETHLAIAFLIQKNHEAFEWWRETVGDQIARVREDAVTSVDKLRGDIDGLREVVARLRSPSQGPPPG